MNIDRLVLAGIWTLSIIGLLCFVPRDKLRNAFLVFFFKQSMTWLFGLSIVQFG